ncbi:MAG: hypothetical protein R2754_05710 [Microthrixaceae bacterium]
MTDPDEPPIQMPRRNRTPSALLRGVQLLILVLVVVAVVAKVFW